MPTTIAGSRVLRFDLFELDVRAGELRKRGIKLRLRGQPLEVLAVLLEHAGQLVTREDLKPRLWPADTFVDFDHSLNNAVAKIRETLGDCADAPRYVETLPRRGYRFIGQVEEVAANASKSQTALSDPSDSRPIQAVAVLPLKDLSAESGHEYFADGMTEALITNLAKIKALRVISRTSAMQYKNAHKSLPQIARELKVDALIEGSVQRSGDRIRITAQLIHAATDQHLWAESYERDYRDILSLQSQIAQQVADEVKVILTPEERARLGKARQVSPEAYIEYLKGRHHWNKRSEQGVRKALAYFQAAIEIDPAYAQAYAGVADSYHVLGFYNVLAPPDAYPKSRAAAHKALDLDDTLPEPYASLGVVKRDFEWDWAGAEKHFQRAIELNPGYTCAHHWRSTLLRIMDRREEALQEKAKSLAMDPLSFVIQADLARMYYYDRDYERALQLYRAAIDIDSSFGPAHLWLARVYQQKGLLAGALAELQIGHRCCGDSPYSLAKLAHGFAVAGRHDEARDILGQLNAFSRDRYVSPYDLALIHLGLEEREQAFAYLEQAFEHRSSWLGYLKLEPLLDPLRNDPRFPDLVRRVGLPA